MKNQVGSSNVPSDNEIVNSLNSIRSEQKIVHIYDLYQFSNLDSPPIVYDWGAVDIDDITIIDKTEMINIYKRAKVYWCGLQHQLIPTDINKLKNIIQIWQENKKLFTNDKILYFGCGWGPKNFYDFHDEEFVHNFITNSMYPISMMGPAIDKDGTLII